jgi:hypothetical protein
VTLRGEFSMARDIYRRTANQEVHELGPRKTKRRIKISHRGNKSDPPRRMKMSDWYRERSLSSGRGINPGHTYSHRGSNHF